MFAPVPDIFDILKRVLQKHANDIEALNKGQLSTGTKSDNTKLPAYQKSYLKTRRKYSRPTSPMDLNLKGDFYEKMFVDYFNSYLSIGSKDGKGPLLEKRFSSDIYGLTPESLDVLVWQKGVFDEFLDDFKKDMFG